MEKKKIKTMNKIRTSVLPESDRMNHFIRLQNLIYAELPDLINKIHIEALMNYEEESPALLTDVGRRWFNVKTREAICRN